MGGGPCALGSVFYSPGQLCQLAAVVFPGTNNIVNVTEPVLVNITKDKFLEFLAVGEKSFSSHTFNHLNCDLLLSPSISMGTINTPEPVKPPSGSFPSTNSQHDIQQTQLKVVPDRSGCRSVKSIVAWLESSSSTQPWSPRSNAVDMAHDLSAGSLSSCHQPQSYNHSASGASEIEDYSLTYLQYKEYFTGAPLARCLDPERRSSTEHQRTNKSVVRQSSRPSVPNFPTEISDGPGHARQNSESREYRAMEKSDGGEVSFIQRGPGEVRAF